MSGITVTTHRSVSHHLIYQYLPAGREIADPTQSVLPHKLHLVRSSISSEPVRAGIAALYEHHQDRLPHHHPRPPLLHHQVELELDIQDSLIDVFTKIIIIFA